MSEVADGDALADALDTALSPDAAEGAARPIALRLLPIVLRELGAEPGKVGQRVPEVTRKKIEALVARPSTTPERFLRELAEQQAVQEVLRDVMYDGLKEFSEKVNPFIAEWGIPALLKRMSLFGGAMTKGLESVRAELDRRTEPELQRFLGQFTKKGLRRMVEVTIAQADQPASIALRKHMVAWALEQELAVLAKGVDAEAVALGQEIAFDVAAFELGRDERRVQRRRLIAEALAAAGDLTVGEALTELGVTYVPDFDAFARATWPIVKALWAAPAARAWVGALVDEFYAEEAKRIEG